MSQNSQEILHDAECHVCKSKSTILRRDSIRYGTKRDVRECTDCGLVFLWPIEPEEKKASDFYQAENFRNLPRKELGLAEHKADEIFAARMDQAQRRLDWVLPHIKPDSTMLEIGCSAGSFCSLAKSKVAKLEAIELDPQFAEYTRTRQGIDVIEQPIEEVVKTDRKYDVIVMWHVLEHLADPIQSLKQIEDMLNPGGFLFIEVPNVDDPLLTIFKSEAFDDFYYQEPHLYYFSEKTLKKTLDLALPNSVVRPFQLYSVWNSINWLTKKKPQKHQAGKGKMIDILDSFYRWYLAKVSKTDTLFAYSQKK